MTTPAAIAAATSTRDHRCIRCRHARAASRSERPASRRKPATPTRPTQAVRWTQRAKGPSSSTVAALWRSAAGRSGLHVELAHHVEVLVRAVVAVEDEAVGEIPELVAHLDALVGADPDHVLEPFQLARARQAALDLHDLEAPEMDVDRMAPAAARVVEDPVLAGVEPGPRIVAPRVEDLAVDRPVRSVVLAEAEEALLHRGLHVGGMLGATQHRRHLARVRLHALHIEG